MSETHEPWYVGAARGARYAVVVLLVAGALAVAWWAWQYPVARVLMLAAAVWLVWQMATEIVEDYERDRARAENRAWEERHRADMDAMLKRIADRAAARVSVPPAPTDAEGG